MEKILPPTQHGSRKGRSTVTNLLNITDFIHDALSTRDQVDCIYFDFTRAFDTLDHSILARKLAAYSMPYFLYHTVMSFVINRKYLLKINGNITSHSFTTQSAVPQGSHCGPILFILMAANMAEITNNTNVFQLGYADDTKFYANVNNFEEQIQLQLCIDKLNKWSVENRISLNPTKTMHASYTKNGRVNFNSRYFINRDVIQKHNVVKDLGVIFDEKLTFKEHNQNLKLKSTRITAMSLRFAKGIGVPQCGTPTYEPQSSYHVLTPYIGLEYASII